MVYATLRLTLAQHETEIQLKGLKRLSIDWTKKTIIAPPVKEKAPVTSILKVIYPLPFGGYAMTPIAIFEWFGKEKVTITEIKEIPAAALLIEAPYHEFQDIIWSGSYIGRQIDGLEIFEESAVTTD